MAPTDKQRREAARRQLQQKLEQRQLDDARRRRTTLISSVVATLVLIIVVVVVIVSVSGNDKKKPAGGVSVSTGTVAPTSSAPAPTSSAPVAAPSYPCTWTKSGTAARPVTVPSTTKPPKTGKVVVTVKTTQGTMTFTLNRTAAPCTVASFVSLVTQKYYNNTPCHRLTTSGIFVLQCGDPTGTGEGGPGYTIPDEYKSTDKFTTGVLAMANTGQPDSGGSQFFIVYKDTSLPPQYTIFGTVTTGLDVVTKVAAKGSNNANGTGDGKPILPITITSMTATT